MLAKFIDKTTIRSWLISLIISIILCAICYKYLTPLGHGIRSTITPEEPITFLNSLYFSMVTITTLGYGDFRPIGFGKAIASFEVLTGIITTAIIISKLASDRTSGFVRLLYTSDNERRLKFFYDEIEECGERLNNALINHDHTTKLKCIKKLEVIVVTLKSYYSYHLSVGAMGEGWAKKNSLKVARSIARATKYLMMAGKEAFVSAVEQRKIESALRCMQKAASTLHQDGDKEIFNSLKLQVDKLVKSYYSSKNDNIKRHYYTEMAPGLIEKIKDLLPPSPWPKNIHKNIASDLRISNHLAHRIITKLIDDGFVK